ncbi:MAG: ankyrin repeat domain-containing protein, partial [Bdellovibrionales bacterium]|nr:ankyrin repeat domain-containing protein [Bdellovibrionales bacterium]
MIKLVLFTIAFGFSIHLNSDASLTDSQKLIVASHGLYSTTVELDVNEIKKLLALGANPNFADDAGATPLTYANVTYALSPTANNLEAVKTLVEAGSDIDHVENWGTGILHLAIVRSYNPEALLDVLQFYLNKGANPNVISFENRSPLLTALPTGNLDVIKLLVSKGADLNHRAEVGNVLHFAVSAHRSKGTATYDLIRELINDEDKIHEFANEPNQAGTTPLGYAASTGNLGVVKSLVEDYQADINHANFAQLTPLDFAIK